MNRVMLILLVLGLSLLPVSAWPYEEVEVVNGGTITGEVLLKGEKPKPKAYNLVLFPETAFCGRISTGTGWRLLDHFLVSSEGGLQNAVVMLEGVERGKPFDHHSPQIEAKDCVFHPSVMVVRDRQDISIVNMDPIMHDVQVYETSPTGQSVLLHRPLRMNPHHSQNYLKDHQHDPGERLIDRLQFSKGRRIFFVECGFHAFMQTWGVAVTNPYFAITDEQGKFSLNGVPEGIYNLVAWHPGLGGVLWMEVAVASGEVVNTRFEFDAPAENRSSHTTMVENPHFEVDALSTFGDFIEVQVTHEVQK